MTGPARPDAAAVAAVFGLPGEVVSYAEVAGGWSNQVLRLGTTAGEWAVKVVRNPWGEPRWLEWLAEGWRLEQAALAAGVPAPEPVPVEGWPVAPVPVAGEDPLPVRVHRWVEGERVPREPVGADVARWVGQMVARVHGQALRPERPDLHVGRPGLTTADVWPSLVERSASAGAVWTAALAAAEPWAWRATALLDPWADADAVLCHGDLDQKNLLLAPAGPLLLDWDVVVPLPPAHDLAHAAVTMAAWREPAVARAVVEGYARWSGAIPSLTPADLGPALASGLGWIRFTVDRALAGDRTAPATLAPALDELPRRVELAERLPDWLAGRL